MSQPAGSGREPRPPRHRGGRAGRRAGRSPCSGASRRLSSPPPFRSCWGAEGAQPLSPTPRGPARPPARRRCPPRSPGGAGSTAAGSRGCPGRGGKAAGTRPSAAVTVGRGGNRRRGAWPRRAPPPRGSSPATGPAESGGGRLPPPASPHRQRGRGGGEGARAAAELPNGRAVLVPTHPPPPNSRPAGARGGINK